jgi:hypothetical protein
MSLKPPPATVPATAPVNHAVAGYGYGGGLVVMDGEVDRGGGAAGAAGAAGADLPPGGGGGGVGGGGGGGGGGGKNANTKYLVSTAANASVVGGLLYDRCKPRTVPTYLGQYLPT